ncbi:hypothetical protein ACA910_018630 [Epithemia clementina (nom. ined.)]
MVFSKYFEKVVKGNDADSSKDKERKLSSKAERQEPLVDHGSKTKKSGTKDGIKEKVRAKRKHSPVAEASGTNSGRPSNEINEANQQNDRKRRRRGQSLSRTGRTIDDVKEQASSNRRVGPSAEALDLSQRLKECSKRKKLAEALSLFWDDANKYIRDAHHACIVVDCCARCGNVSQAESVLRGIPSEVARNSIELQTALIKGYAHAGDLHNAMRVYKSLFPRQGDQNNHKPRSFSDAIDRRPNVRTLNTLLRGALWTAAMPSSSNKSNQEGSSLKTGSVAGGVVSSEEAWNIYQKNCSGEQSPPDWSSYEVTIAILCQSLRIADARNRIEEYQRQYNIRIKGKASIKAENPDQSTFETLGAVYLCLARANAMLGNWDEVWDACQRSMRGIEASRSILQDNSSNNNTVPETEGTSKRKGRQSTTGGKQAWKKDSSNIDGQQADRRNTSNLAYRGHRLSEMELEVKSLLNLRKEKQAQPTASLDELHARLISKLFYFGGGGSTELSSKDQNIKSKAISKRTEFEASVLPNWISFGLCQVHGILIGQTMDRWKPPDSVWQSFQKSFDSKGFLKTKHIFGESSSRPLDVELGAGSGDWIVRQAQSHPERNYMAVELRADRVHQIFAKASLQQQQQHHGEPLTNVCVVGADAGDFLQCRLKKGSVSTIFVNYPEPPTQTYGEDRVDLDKIESGDEEPAHILCYANLKKGFACLKMGGQFVIVTDNKWYARLISITLARLSLEEKSLLCSLDHALLAKNGFREVENTSGRNNIKIYEGHPNAAIGHVQEDQLQGVSYFDRLWRTGASSYSQTKSRFVVGIRKKEE